MSEQDKPLPCPFCGHTGLTFREGSTFRWVAYSCGGCGMGSETRMQTMGDGAKEEWRAQAEIAAIKEWNTRPAAPVAEPISEQAKRSVFVNPNIRKIPPRKFPDNDAPPVPYPTGKPPLQVVELPALPEPRTEAAAVEQDMSDSTTKLRQICGHDSHSVDGCVTCEAADEIEVLRRKLHIAMSPHQHAIDDYRLNGDPCIANRAVLAAKQGSNHG